FTLAELMAQNITQGSQNVPTAAHAPGMLSANAITSSLLFGALNLPAAMVSHLSVSQIEALAASETRLSNILAGQQGLRLLRAATTTTTTGGLHYGLLEQIPGIGGLGTISKGLTVLGSGSNAGAVPLSLVIGGGGC